MVNDGVKTGHVAAQECTGLAGWGACLRSPWESPPRAAACRMHGGVPGSGAPKGNKNAVKHGYYTREAIEQPKRVETRALYEASDRRAENPKAAHTRCRKIDRRNLKVTFLCHLKWDGGGWRKSPCPGNRTSEPPFAYWIKTVWPVRTKVAGAKIYTVPQGRRRFRR